MMLNQDGNKFCTSQKQIFWYLCQQGIYDVEILKARGRYVILQFGVGKLFSTDIRRLNDMTLDDWAYEVISKTTDPIEHGVRVRYKEEHGTYYPVKH